MAENRFPCASSGSSRDTVCIETNRVLDSCRDRDCFENVRVYLSCYGNELLERTDAQAAYLPIKVFAVLEGIALISLTVLMALGMRSFIIKNTGIEKCRDTYGKADRDRHLALTVRAYILFSLVGLIALVKIIKVFVDADVTTIFTQTGMIVTSGAPWLLWVGVGLSLCLVIYSFIYLGELRSEVRFKYDGDTEDTRRGRFE